MNLTYFVHSTTEDNEVGLATGWAHSPLSARGQQQARELQEFLAGRFDVIYVSDAQRAVETTTLALGENAAFRQDWRLREINYGHLSQQPSKQVKARLTDHIDTPYPEGESYRDVEKRLRDFLASLKNLHPAKASIALVAHQAPQLALDVILNNKTWEQAFRDDWRNTHAWQPGWLHSFS